MPEQAPSVVETVVTPPLPAKQVVVLRDASLPPEPFESWCDWARDGLRKALEGTKQAGGGVVEYHIGSRGLRREGLKSQVDNVAYWNQLVKYYCGEAGLPGSVTGADTACRIIPRDV